MLSHQHHHCNQYDIHHKIVYNNKRRANPFHHENASPHRHQHSYTPRHPYQEKGHHNEEHCIAEPLSDATTEYSALLKWYPQHKPRLLKPVSGESMRHTMPRRNAEILAAMRCIEEWETGSLREKVFVNVSPSTNERLRRGRSGSSLSFQTSGQPVRSLR